MVRTLTHSGEISHPPKWELSPAKVRILTRQSEALTFGEKNDFYLASKPCWKTPSPAGNAVCMSLWLKSSMSLSAFIIPKQEWSHTTVAERPRKHLMRVLDNLINVLLCCNLFTFTSRFIPLFTSLDNTMALSENSTFSLIFSLTFLCSCQLHSFHFHCTCQNLLFRWPLSFSTHCKCNQRFAAEGLILFLSISISHVLGKLCPTLV